MAETRIRYCQRCNKKQVLIGMGTADPCTTCGGVYFDKSPKHWPHTTPDNLEFTLTDDDITFLLVQGIKPE